MKAFIGLVLILLAFTLVGCQEVDTPIEIENIETETIGSEMGDYENNASQTSVEEEAETSKTDDLEDSKEGTTELETEQKDNEIQGSEVAIASEQNEASQLEPDEVTSQTSSVTAQEQEIQMDESSDEEEKVLTSDQDIEEVIVNENIWAFDEEKIAFSVSKGFPSPLEAVRVKHYAPSNNDSLDFESGLTGVELFNALKKKDFVGLTVVYEKNQINWNLFFEELHYSENNKVLTVSLKEENIYEAEYVDEYSSYERYYQQDEGIYYEVSDLMMGTYSEGVEQLTRQRMGTAIYQGVLKDAPTYNPLILKEGELLLECHISELDAQPVIYLESAYEERLYRRWISIEYGVVARELVFSEDGLIQEIKEATEITQTKIDDWAFYPPMDVAYQDATLFIYMAEGGTLEPLREALGKALPEEQFSVKLETSSGASMMLHSSGYSGGQRLDEMVLVYDSEDELGTAVTLRNFRDGDYYYTICDTKKIVERYESSCDELKIFDFETTGFRGAQISDETITYTFQDLGLGSVRGFTRYYAYEISLDTDQLINLQIYYKEAITDEILPEEMIVFKLKDYGVTDASIVQIPEDYKLYTNYLGSHYDSEYPPVWWRTEQ